MTRLLLVFAATAGLLAGCAVRESASVPASPAAAPQSETRALVDPTWGILMRQAWAKGNPDTTKTVAMGAIRLITVLRKPEPRAFESIDAREVATHLEDIREYQTTGRGWGDISYHFAIDCAGRVWQCRPLGLQGTFASQHNEGNIGINLLGGDLDAPVPEAQRQATLWLLEKFRGKFNVPMARIFTLRELAVTADPGNAVIDFMNAYRRGTVNAEAMRNVRGDAGMVH